MVRCINLRILVRMKLLAERAIRPLDILVRRTLIQPQNLVVVLRRKHQLHQDQRNSEREENSSQ